MSSHTRTWAVALGLVLAGSLAGAAEWKEVNAAKVKAMMDEGNVMVINPLSRIEFNDLHISGSISIPSHELESKLPPAKATRLVFYCLGPK